MKKIILFISVFVLTINVIFAQSCFSQKNDFEVGTYPCAIKSADFNGDGKMDLVTANYTADNVSILLGNGSGQFAKDTAFHVYRPISMTINDFNGDGKVDIATVSESNSKVYVLIGNGFGGFSTATDFTTGINTTSITSTDFNGDGKKDIATSNAAGNVSILIGNGLGGFSSFTSFTVGTGPVCIITADFNNDGKMDLVTANSSGFISVILGNGLGSFSTVTNFSVGTIPNSIISADFNGDNKMDLVTANNIGNISVLLGNGLGGFSLFTTRNTGNGRLLSITNADFDSDGKMDIATTDGYGDLIVLKGNGSGDLNIFDRLYVGSGNYPVVFADFNNDSKMDLATASVVSNKVSVLLGTISLNFSQTNLSCKGGFATATVGVNCGKAPFTYLWNTSPIQRTAIATGLSEGFYSVTVTDATNFSKTDTIYIYPPSLSANISTTLNNVCSGVCNGTATVTVWGGTPPYTYLWDSLAKKQTSNTALNLCPGTYSVTISDSTGCITKSEETIQLLPEVNPNIYLTNLAAIDQAKLSPAFASFYSYNLPTTINANPSNPRNFVDAGKKARFKVECTNQKANGQSIVSGICKVRSNSPYIKITDSSSALNNIGWSNKAWSADEFEIDIDPKTPPGQSVYIDFVVQENGQDYATTCISIPVSPLVYSTTTSATIDDDNNPDSKGNDNDICDPNETIEFYPWLDNNSPLNAEYVRGKFENLDNHSFIKIWNDTPGVNTRVFDATWWNFSFAKPQTINLFSKNTTPEYDFVFDYKNNTTTNDFKLYLVLAGGFRLFNGDALSLVQWSLPYTFSNKESVSINDNWNKYNYLNIYPNPSTGILTFENNGIEPNEVQVFDLNGKLVDSFRLDRNSTKTINYNSFSSGLYLVNVTCENGKVSNSKIVISK